MIPATFVTKEAKMAQIVESIEIARRPEDVFAYVTDPAHLPDWQESVVSVRRQDEGPVGAGSRVVITRRIGRMERTMTSELGDFNPPKTWKVRGLDGPIRGMVNGTVEPLDNGERSRVTIALDLQGRGIGKLLLPLVVHRQAAAEMPTNMRNLKQRLESGTA
jgi:uncharacterized protein YndB with AHSA1/START domain